jgi:hypothetical protein
MFCFVADISSKMEMFAVSENRVAAVICKIAILCTSADHLASFTSSRLKRNCLFQSHTCKWKREPFRWYSVNLCTISLFCKPSLMGVLMKVHYSILALTYQKHSKADWCHSRKHVRLFSGLLLLELSNSFSNQKILFRLVDSNGRDERK